MSMTPERRREMNDFFLIADSVPQQMYSWEEVFDYIKSLIADRRDLHEKTHAFCSSGIGMENDIRTLKARIAELEGALEKADQVIAGLVPQVRPNGEDIQWTSEVLGKGE